MASAMASSLMEIETSPEKTTFKVVKQVVPWESPEIFRKVYEYLYSPDVTKKRWAVDELAAWESRCQTSLGTAIEASMVITRAIIQDILTNNITSLCQEQDVQYMYALALIRFVNLTVEVHQSDTKQSTAQIAKGLGIPSWIVDLRNEAAHSNLPSIQALRSGAHLAMEHLDEAYWKIEAAKELKMIKKEDFNYEEIIESLYLYRTRQYHVLVSKEKTEEVARELEDIKRLLGKLKKQISNNRKQVFHTLLLNGVFIPFEDEIPSFLSHKDQKEFNYKAEGSYQRALSRLHEDDDDDEDFEILKKLGSLPSVPILLQKLWCPLLRIMNKYHAIPEFLEALLFTQQDRHPVGQKILLSWVMQILLLHPERADVKKDKIREIFTGGNAMFNWDRLLHAAIAAPCKYVVFILPIIFSNLEYKEAEIKRIFHLVSIAVRSIDFRPSEHRHVFNLQELKKAKRLQEKKKEDRRKVKKLETAGNLFEEDPDIFWNNFPIGYNVCTPKDDSEKDISEAKPNETKENTEKYLLWNEHDNEEDMEVVMTDFNTFEDDKHILNQMDCFLYKRRS